MKRVQIAYLTAFDARDRCVCSGLLYHMAEALDRYVGDVHHLGPIHSRALTLAQYVNRAVERVSSSSYDVYHSLLLSWRYACIAGRRLKAADADLVFAPMGSTLIALLNTRLPIVYTSDATAKLLYGYYPGLFGRAMRFSRWEGNLIEKRAIRKSSLILYTSRWAADSAARDYGADPEKIVLLPWAANLEEDQVPAREVALRGPALGHCRLLFIGVNWQRKGGPIALETLVALRAMGVAAELIVCGCRPPADVAHPHMRVIPRLNKNVPEEREQLSALFREATFLLLPTRADCTPFVCCEASAFGLPVLAADVGGVSGVVEHGVNGLLFPAEARGEVYAKAIMDLLGAPERLAKLRQTARDMYESKLSWKAWASAFRSALESQTWGRPLAPRCGERT